MGSITASPTPDPNCLNCFPAAFANDSLFCSLSQPAQSNATIMSTKRIAVAMVQKVIESYRSEAPMGAFAAVATTLGMKRPSGLAFFAAMMMLMVSIPPAWACTGRVIGVTDGDTMKMLCDGIETKVRLDQIDAPERNQPFGSKAKEVLSNLVFNRTVRLESSGTDRYGRTLGTLWIGETDANREMIRMGYAWAYRRYLRDQSLIEVEADAKASRRGLWSDPNPIPPWDFRKVARGKRQGGGD